MEEADDAEEAAPILVVNRGQGDPLIDLAIDDPGESEECEGDPKGTPEVTWGDAIRERRRHGAGNVHGVSNSAKPVRIRSVIPHTMNASC